MTVSDFLKQRILTDTDFWYLVLRACTSRLSKTAAGRTEGSFTVLRSNTVFLDSSMVEHTAVNRGVVGSSPTRGGSETYLLFRKNI